MMAKIAFPKTKTLLICALAAVVAAFAVITGVSVAFAAEDDATYTADGCFAEGYQVCVDVEAEGSVLLKNNGVLPLAEGTKVTLLGTMSYKYVEGGTGSAGGKDDEDTIMMDVAFEEAGLDVNDAAWNWLTGYCDGLSGVSWTSYTSIHEVSIDNYTDNASTILQSGYTDYAIVTFARSGAEGATPSMSYSEDSGTYLELNSDEKDLLLWCKQNFTHTIILINSAAAMELGFLEDDTYGVDACLWIGHPGEAGLVGVGTLLTGRNNPSGALVDTYAYDMSTMPAFYNDGANSYAEASDDDTEDYSIKTYADDDETPEYPGGGDFPGGDFPGGDFPGGDFPGGGAPGGGSRSQTYYEYEEGIYVGYRWYETADKAGYFDSDSFKGIEFKNGKVTTGYDGVVQFPFGYGMSYTTFSQELRSSSIKLEAHGTNSVTVRVTNTGDVAGKEVVQLYMEAPYNQDSTLGISGRGLEKSEVVLVGYAKTDELKPGDRQDVTIEFATDDLASYDNYGQGCYVLEKGDYYFNIQDNAHCWSQDETDANAVYGSAMVTLSDTLIYNDTTNGVGKRDSDATVATNALDDVTAGDGAMVDGYLSRSDFASGMTQIMQYSSNSNGEVELSAEIQKCLALSGKDSYDYTFETYKNGVKTTVTETIYCFGNNIMPFSTETPDGKKLSDYGTVTWDATYYVLEDSDGNVKKNSDGYFDVLTSAPTDGSAYHKLCVEDMVDISIYTDEGLAIWQKLAQETSLIEAIEVQGSCGWQVPAVKSVGKELQVALDGPGEPGNAKFNGMTWFPCAVSIAATWNNDVAYAEGEAYGHQCVLCNVGCAYAPAMNTHRTPFGGRNFEYYSEDGFIAGNIGGNAVAGIQSSGTNVFIKHFALNDGDANRQGNTTWACEQAIREIYLRPYEISCKDYGANGIMGSLNRIGMSWFHYGLYKTILRDQWGWMGMLITDGDGSASDAYNNPQAMMCVEGSMLGVGCYVNNSAVEAAYGSVNDSNYAQQCLQNNMMHCLYQYAYGGIGATESSSNTVMIVVIVVVAVVVVAAVVVGVVVGVRRSKKKKAQAQ